MEGAALEMVEGCLFELDVPVRVTRGKALGMTDPGWHNQRRMSVLCGYTTSSCFIIGFFLGYFCVGISMLGDAFHELFHPRLRVEMG